VELDDVELRVDAPSDELIALDEVLEKLTQKDKLMADLVKLRYFVGLTSVEAAKALGISTTTAKRRWRYARAWLLREIDARQQ